MEAGRTGRAITDTWATVFFGPVFTETPRLIGVMASYQGHDSATIRYDEDSLTAGSVQVHVQEDTSDDGETDHDNPEVMGYLAIEGSGVLSATKASDWITQTSGLGQPTTLVSGTVIRRSTYELAGQPIALRVTTIVSGTASESALYHLHLDHLGSVTILSDYADGTVVSGTLALHEPFGDYRSTPTTALTDRGFTGHRGNNLPGNDLGLIYMNARYYVSYINRFLTPDTIVPDPTNPQSLSRYSYALNNPLRYVDPSGHAVCENGPGSCEQDPHYQTPVNNIHLTLLWLTKRFDVVFTEDNGQNWSSQQKLTVMKSVIAVSHRLAKLDQSSGQSASEAFRAIYGTVTFHRLGKQTDYGAETFGLTIEVYDSAFANIPLSPNFKYNIVHELGHSFNYVMKTDYDTGPYGELGRALGGSLPERHLVRDGMYPYPLQQNTRDSMNTDGELFGDGFLNWTLSSFRDNYEGNQTSNWFEAKMSLWVSNTGS